MRGATLNRSIVRRRTTYFLKHREDGFFDAVWIDKKNAISDQTIESYDSLGEANGGFIKQTFLDHVKEKGHNVRQPVRWTGSGGMGLRSGNVTGMELKEHKTRFFHDSLDCLPNALFNLLDLMQQVTVLLCLMNFKCSV